MEFKEYDFTRNPVVQNEDFFLESKCASCGLSILACSIDELVEQEAAHRTQCRRRSNSAA
jgi:predicted molibdopterin-dependent oxidoreductase YjgC